MMLYVELVLYPRGEVVAVNPLQVIGIKSLAEHKDKVSLLFAVGEWIVFGDYRLVKNVLAGESDAITQYDKKWTKPAKKEGPRKVMTPIEKAVAGGVEIQKP